MKNGILKLVAVLVLGTAALQSCSVDNHYRRNRYDRGRGYDRHHYNNYNNGYDRYHRY